MKSEAIRIVSESESPTAAYLKLREYLQHVILRVLFEQKDLQNLIFHGGTALRIIHGLNRFSEDLNFHLKDQMEYYSLAPVVSRLRKNLALQGYSTSDTVVKEKTVRSTFIIFENLLFECGLSPNVNEKLSVKLEVDANPPAGWEVERNLINDYFPIGLIHHDLPSFLAGKFHAILQRPYTKGRDFYDIIFLLSRWKNLEPNLSYLQNALTQTGYSGKPLNQDTWRYVISTTAKTLNWNHIRDDIRPFLMSPGDYELLDLDILLGLLS